MIIEFIGSTGAGKTTLIAEVRRRLAQTAEVTTAFELVAAPLGLRGVTHPTAQNLVQELVGLPFFLQALGRHRAFVVFILKMIARHGSFSLFTIHYLRSLERTIGAHEVIRRREGNRIVLVDEGTIILAHNVFVYTSALYSSEEISTFARLVPLPDVIVYVRAPVDTLIKRSLQRTDPPREMKSKSRALIEQYTTRAVAMFEQLIKAENMRSRILIVDNPEAADKGWDELAHHITEFILHYEPASN
jgi:thymidylate kinase